MKSLSNSLFYSICIGCSLFVLFVIMLPIVGIISHSTQAVWKLSLHDPLVWRSLFLTLKLSTLVTLLGIVIGIPVAYVLARFRFKGKGLLEAILMIPMFLPHFAAGLALLTVVGKRFWLGRLLANWGIQIVGSSWGIALAMFFVSLPFLIMMTKTGIEKVDPRLEHVSLRLGATQWQTFYHITFPLVFRHIVSGCIIMWARAMSEFGAILVLAYHPMVFSVKLMERFESYGLYHTVPIVTVMVGLGLGLIILLRWLTSSHIDTTCRIKR